MNDEFIQLLNDSGHLFIIQSIGLYLMITILVVYVIADFSADLKEKKLLQKARSYKGRGKYPPLPGDKQIVEIVDRDYLIKQLTKEERTE